MIIFGVQGIIFPLELFPRFILHRASPPFCSRYIFSSPLLAQLAVQGRNLLETSFLSTSSPLRLPFNLFLRLFLRLHFRSSRPSSSSWIFSLGLFLVNANFFFDLIPSSDILFICSSLSKLFPPDPLVALLFPFISVFVVFHFQLLVAPETSYPSFFISTFFFVFSFLFFLSSYKKNIFNYFLVLIWSPFRTSLSAVLFTENFVSLLPSCCLTFTSFFSAFPLWSVVPSRLRNHI